MLSLPHMAPLNAYVGRLRCDARATVPDFDPLDAGCNAQILFLFEKPGPMTDPAKPKGKAGSGFISRDNDDPTAEATFRFMQDAGLPRSRTAIWNVVPWWNGTTKICSAELDAGLQQLGSLVALLSNLRTIVCVGRKAQRAEATVRKMGFRYLASAHPSPVNRAFNKQAWRQIPNEWRKAGTDL